MRRTIGAMAVLMVCGTAIAGPIDPPAGPVASTMKTLDQVEARTPINLATCPGDDDSLLRISQPGSYYLTGNVVGVASKAGIEVAADDVTIDLNGFQLRGTADSRWAVTASGTVRGLTVRNGTIRGWGSSGITGSPEHARVQDVTISDCQGFGVNVGAGSMVEGVEVRGSSMIAINVAQGSRVVDCTVVGGPQGYWLGWGATAVGCSATQTLGRGFVAGPGAVLRDCSAAWNEGDGFELLEGSTLESCVAWDNAGDGVVASSGCVVTSVNSRGNTGAGFVVSGTSNRVDSCQASANAGYGFRILAADNLVVRNSARGNTGGSYSIPNGSEYGQIITNPGNGFAATNPWANFSY